VIEIQTGCAFTGFAILPDSEAVIKSNLRWQRLFFKLHQLFIGHKAMFANKFWATEGGLREDKASGWFN